MTRPLLDREQFLSRWSELHGGYDPLTGSVLVRGWLAVVVWCARPVLRVRPDLLTAAGVLVAGIACWTAGFAAPVAAVAVLVSALLDGLLGRLDGRRVVVAA